MVVTAKTRTTTNEVTSKNGVLLIIKLGRGAKKHFNRASPANILVSRPLLQLYGMFIYKILFA